MKPFMHEKGKEFLSRKEIRSFLVRFFLLFLLVEGLLFFIPPTGYQVWLATSIGGWFSAPVHEIWIMVAHGNFEITPSCTGITSASLFLGLLWGFPSLPKKKLFYSAGGILLLLLLNYFRLLLVVAAGDYYSLLAAEVLHILSWFILSGIAFGIWFAILHHTTGEKTWRGIGKALLVAHTRPMHPHE